jgi:hypothetical protein
MPPTPTAVWGLPSPAECDSHINGEAPPWLRAVWGRWREFSVCEATVRAGRACWLLRWHAFTFGPGSGDDRYARYTPPVKQSSRSLDSSSQVDGH